MLQPGLAMRDDLVLTRRLGMGAFAEVWSAGPRLGDEHVAVKVLQSGNPEYVKRFERETRVWKQLDASHPNIVGWLGSGALSGKWGVARPYIVMEYIDGGSLDTVIRDVGRFAPTEAVEIAVQILRGLAHAHERGVVHRDVKPGNVLIGSQAEISDFGLSLLVDATRLSQDSSPIGTIQYAAPEQLSLRATSSSDIYAVGAILFHMLAGRLPFDAHGSELVSAVYGEAAPDVREFADKTPAALAQLVATALAKDTADRPATAHEFAAALEEMTG